MNLADREMYVDDMDCDARYLLSNTQKSHLINQSYTRPHYVQESSRGSWLKITQMDSSRNNSNCSVSRKCEEKIASLFSKNDDTQPYRWTGESTTA